MLNDKQRLLAVEKRAEELRHKKVKRKYTMMALTALTACEVFILALAAGLSKVMDEMPHLENSTNGLAASIFAQNGWIGYAVIGLLAFTIGICFALLCMKLKKKAERERRDTHDGRGF